MVKGDGARSGAMSGAIAGAGVLIGQLLGTVGSLFYTQNSGTQPLFGTIPSAGDTSLLLVYYGSGLAVGFCIGLFGIALAAGSGAATGYLGTSTDPQIAA
jgi:hypothetical protein